MCVTCVPRCVFGSFILLISFPFIDNHIMNFIIFLHKIKTNCYDFHKSYLSSLFFCITVLIWLKTKNKKQPYTLAVFYFCQTLLKKTLGKKKKNEIVDNQLL